jgi:hypothetical protein
VRIVDGTELSSDVSFYLRIKVQDIVRIGAGNKDELVEIMMMSLVYHQERFSDKRPTQREISTVQIFSAKGPELRCGYLFIERESRFQFNDISPMSNILNRYFILLLHCYPDPSSSL